LEIIEEGAFAGVDITGTMALPKNLAQIGNSAFEGTFISSIITKYDEDFSWDHIDAGAFRYINASGNVGAIINRGKISDSSLKAALVNHGLNEAT
jgi:hypothetical protein